LRKDNDHSDDGPRWTPGEKGQRWLVNITIIMGDLLVVANGRTASTCPFSVKVASFSERGEPFTSRHRARGNDEVHIGGSGDHVDFVPERPLGDSGHHERADFRDAAGELVAHR
jgi:hypothetical protein